MNEFLSSVAAGLGQGSIYALIALGFVIIYLSTRVVSFAQPAFMIAGAVLVSYLVEGVGFWLALVLGVAGIAALGLGVERTVVRPMVGKPVFIIAIITIGVDIAVRVVVNGFIGTNVRQVHFPWSTAAVDIFGIGVQERYVAMFIGTAIVVGVLFYFIKFTRLGLALRATAFDQETALSQGISVGTVFAMSWAIAAGLAGLAGVFASSQVGMDQNLWIIALKALPAIIIGGLDSLGGAVLGGLLVGVVESLVNTYQGDYFPWLGANFGVVSPYVLMLLVLLVRPYGLFGTKEVERV